MMLAQHFREATERPPGPEPELINDDLTKVKLGELLSERGIDSCILFGNIPYYLTRDVLFGYLVDHHHCIEAAYIMMQKEVADRIVSPPGSRVYGITSVILQALYDVRMVMKVAPGSFQPRPRVSSAVLEFRVLEEKLVEEHELRPFVNLVKNLFQQRRKKISSTLRSFYGLGPDELNALHAATDIDMRSRPESLSRDQFIELMRQMPEVSSK